MSTKTAINNEGHRIEFMVVPAIPDTIENQFAVGRQLTDLASLVSHQISFCKMMLLLERRKDRNGIPTRNEDGSAQAEYYQAAEDTAIPPGLHPSDYSHYAPRVWPKDFKLF